MSNLILDKENIKTQSVVDFEGIENITKFKFRNTKPKYPKPGTFYWIEEDVPMEDNGEINIEHKYGIYFVNNDKELLRLDSNMFQIITSNEPDSYIQISGKNDLDQQTIYLIIGKYVKEESVDENGLRIFKVTDIENKGLSTVEATVEYVSDSNNMIYMSNVEDFWEVGKRLGDIRVGYTKDDIKDKTISEILDTIIFPTLQPEITQPSVTISDNILKSVFGDIDIKDGHVVIKKNQDNINKLNELLNKFRSEEIGNYLTIDPGHLTYPTENGYNNYAGNVIKFDYYVPNVIDMVTNSHDRYEFSIGVTFDDGQTPLDNKRNPARYEDKIDTCDCENGCDKCYIPPFKSQEILSNKFVIDVVYPIYTNSINNQNNDINNITECPVLLDYVNENGDSICLEFPREWYGFRNNTDDGNGILKPLKMCVCIPDGTHIDVYQYNEFTKEYDIPVDMGSFLFYKQVSDITLSIDDNNMTYCVFIRGCEGISSYKNSTDTQTKSVKYKINIRRN